MLVLQRFVGIWGNLYNVLTTNWAPLIVMLSSISTFMATTHNKQSYARYPWKLPLIGNYMERAPGSTTSHWPKTTFTHGSDRHLP